MRILFIKLLHIGDSLLMTPTLAAVRESCPTAEIFVVIRKGSEGILEGCNGIDHIFPYTPIEYENRNIKTFMHDLDIIRGLRKYNFDYIFELTDKSRARWLVSLLKGKNKIADGTNTKLNIMWKGVFDEILTFHQPHLHTVEKDYRIVKEVLALPDSPPALQYSRDVTEPIFENIIHIQSNYAVLRMATRWKSKEWPMENWIELTQWLLQKFDQVVINTSSDQTEIEQAKSLQENTGENCIFAEKGMSFSELAYLLYRAKIYVGVDTVTTHLSAACGCPTVAFYGMSDDRVYGPWKVKHKIIALKNRNLNQAFKTFEENRYMADITVARAKGDISEFLKELERDDTR